jgi:predicted nucleic acid-binding protein
MASAMRDKASDVMPPDAIVLPVQTLGELFNVLVRERSFSVRRSSPRLSRLVT